VSCSSGKSVIFNKLKTKENDIFSALFPFRISQILSPKWFSTPRDLLQYVISGPQNQYHYDRFYTTVQVIGYVAVIFCGHLTIAAS